MTKDNRFMHDLISRPVPSLDFVDFSDPRSTYYFLDASIASDIPSPSLSAASANAEQSVRQIAETIWGRLGRIYMTSTTRMPFLTAYMRTRSNG